MQNLKRQLPNLNALLCFEAAGRWQSFTRAADELCVTQGAVSRQVRQLETELGVVLFKRSHRAVALTDEGRRYHHAVAVALGHLADATEDVMTRPGERMVTVVATAAIAMFWLMPRLPTLKAAFPDVEVQVLATDVDLGALEDSYDIGIQYGHGRWPTLESAFLAPGEVLPVCSPSFLAERGPFDRPEALLEQPLLHLDDRRMDWVSWPAWFRAAGIEGPKRPPALRVNSCALLNKAAFEGHGIALGMRHLIEEHLAQEWLVVACDLPVQTELGFYLVAPLGKRLEPDSCIVRDWILAEFRGA